MGGCRVTHLIGLIGSLLLALCAFPEALSAIETGECKVGYRMLILWGLGEILMTIYNYQTHNDMWLYINYLLNILFIGIMLKYKMFPRREW